MIYVECTIVNLITATSMGKYSKEFSGMGDFNAWYRVAKQDPDFVINIMKYNPNDRPALKIAYDSLLLRTSRRVAV